MRAPVRFPGLFLLFGVAVAVAGSATGAGTGGPPSPPRRGGPMIAAATVPEIGKPIGAKWTPTTIEAAATEAQKKVLATGKPVTVTGEVVDVSCYMQLGKRGEAHVACGTKCIANGQPIGIVDADENLYIVMPEEHHPRRDGQADIRTLFAQN